MKFPPFTYHRPRSIEEALDLLAEHGDDAKVLAGGQSLLPVMALRLGRPEHIVDIGSIVELATIDVDDDRLRVGAMVRHAEAEGSPRVAERAPLLRAALPHVGHRAIRSRGTVVGSIAHADAAAELPAVCLATNAEIELRSATQSRTINAADFFDGHFTTVAHSDELVTSVRFGTPGTHHAVIEQSRRHGDYAMVGVACQLTIADAIVTSAALAFFGVSSTAVRVAEAEAALIGTDAGPEAIASMRAAVTDVLEPDGDIHATAAYRRHVAGVVAARSIHAALHNEEAAA